MVMFSFKGRFIEPIRLKTKRQTIRTPRKRNARPGDRLQLYTGARMSPVKLGEADCLDAGSILLHLDHDRVSIAWAQAGTAHILTGIGLDAFAVEDGFGDWDDLKDFWRETHDPSGPFEGHIQQWGGTFVPHQTGE